MENYTKGPVVGDGTYSKVYQGLHKATGRVVALKKIKMGTPGSGRDKTAERELAAVCALQHPSVISILESFKHKGNTIVVYKFMEADLEELIRKRNIELTEGAIKSYMKSLLEALHHCHSNGFLHRDIKPNNLLLDSDGTLKLADFGLARRMPPEQDKQVGEAGDSGPCSSGEGTDQQAPSDSPTTNSAQHHLHKSAIKSEPMTPQVSHVCYKPPELMLGDKHYGPSLDIWAAGCVFAELMLRRVLFPGKSDIDQLHIIFEQIGSPPEGCYQDLPLRDFISMFQGFRGQTLEEIFAGCSPATPAALDLLGHMLNPDPRTRISAAQALQHSFFLTGEPPADKDTLPKPSQWKPAMPARGMPEFYESAAVVSGPAGRVEERPPPRVSIGLKRDAEQALPVPEGSRARIMPETACAKQGKATPIPSRVGGTDCSNFPGIYGSATAGLQLSTLQTAALSGIQGCALAEVLPSAASATSAAPIGSLRKPTPPPASMMGPPSARRSSLNNRNCLSASTTATELSSSGVDLCPSTAPSSSSCLGFGAPRATPAIPMSALDLDGSFEAPTPSLGDLRSLRKRKLDMDAALIASP